MKIHAYFEKNNVFNLILFCFKGNEVVIILHVFPQRDLDFCRDQSSPVVICLLWVNPVSSHDHCPCALPADFPLSLCRSVLALDRSIFKMLCSILPTVETLRHYIEWIELFHCFCKPETEGRLFRQRTSSVKRSDVHKRLPEIFSRFTLLQILSKLCFIFRQYQENLKNWRRRHSAWPARMLGLRQRNEKFKVKHVCFAPLRVYPIMSLLVYASETRFFTQRDSALSDT